MENPKDGSTERIILDTCNHIFSIIFGIETLLKCITFGVVIGPEAYLKNGWNILDGTLVLISVVNVLADFATSGQSPQIFEILRVLRLLRALRPLRVINRAPALKVTVMSLAMSIKDLGNILLIYLMFFLIFGILGVQLFRGQLYECHGPDVGNVTTREECEANPENRWKNFRFNFDNLIEALFSLFVVSIMDGWMIIMHKTVDAVGVDMQPQYRHAEWRAVYFVSFIILMSFLVMNMVVGVLVDNFYEVNEKMKQEAIILRQKKLEHLKNHRRNGIIKHESWMRVGVRNFVSHSYFDLGLAIVILLNIGVMSTEHYNMSADWKMFHRISNYIFTIIFIVEAALRIYGLGFLKYFEDRWNKIDLFIVVISIVGIVVSEVSASNKSLSSNTKLLRLLRMTRIFRVIKLLKSAKGFMALMNTFIRALPQVANLAIILGLQLFIFAAIGVELFGRVDCTPQNPCEGLDNNYAHFHNFGMSVFTLFRISTADNWHGIMKDTLRENCDAGPNCLKNCCVSTAMSGVYFVIYVLLTQFILLNIVVAVLMKGFEESAAEEDSENVEGGVSEGCGGLTDIEEESTIANQSPAETPRVHAVEQNFDAAEKSHDVLLH